VSIRRLPPEIASKIAAGEVIERPASVVKEAIENALDAGATRITVEVVNGGRDLIRVTDDGQGILRDELELAIAPHSTSKLSSVEDLARITTLGFRGEALASIAAVAELELASVTDARAPGRRLLARDGRLVEAGPWAGPRGTQLTVRGLFRSLPARLEFLKTDRTELAQITSAVTHAALGYPGVAFRLLDGATERLRTPGSGSLRETLRALYGSELLDALLELPPGQTLGIDGFISPPGLHRPARNYISLFVNGRWVADRLLAGAINEAYRSLLPSDRFPVVILRLTLPPGEVDVNVHPAKAEVRFRHAGEVYGKVAATLRRALLASGAVAPTRLDRPVVDAFYFPPSAFAGASSQPGPPRALRPPGQAAPPFGDFGAVAVARPFAGLRAGSSGPDESPVARPSGRDDSSEARTLGRDSAEPAPGPVQLSSPMLRPLGQIEHAYIVAAGPGGLYLIDQHAAHERVLYERLTAAANGATQPLLEPANVELSPDDSELLAAHAESLGHLGLHVEPFGGTTWLVRGMPSARRPVDPAAYLHGVLTELRQPEMRRFEMAERLGWSVACQAAVKAGEPLALEEMRELLDALQRCDLSRVCPHGRPTTILLSREMLDRQFGRT